LSWVLCGCKKKPDSTVRVPKNARPELRQAVSAICKPTILGDNFDDELQVAYRLHILTVQQHFKPEPKERATLRAILTNEVLSSYSRMCAAFFLADSELAARALLTNYLASSNLRRRYNAARTIQWFAWRPNDEAREWAVRELIKMVENRSLEPPPGLQSSSNLSMDTEADGADYLDEMSTPLHYVVFSLADLRERRAIPALTSLAQRGDGYDYGAPSALQRINSPPVPLIRTQGQGEDRFEALLTEYDVAGTDQGRVEAIRTLGKYADQRGVDKLVVIAVSSGSTFLRRNAIGTLAGMDDTNALLALVSIIEASAIPPTNFDKGAILDGRPPDYSRREAARALREATYADFQYDTRKWRHWIVTVGNKFNKVGP
jgi:hypothetical protein